MRKGDKNGKGLRHFSMKVCEKVQKKGTTSYNEVADELVAEFTSAGSVMPTDSVSLRCGRCGQDVATLSSHALLGGSRKGWR